jgi:hypothetical protein
VSDTKCHQPTCKADQKADQGDRSDAQSPRNGPAAFREDDDVGEGRRGPAWALAFALTEDQDVDRVRVPTRIAVIVDSRCRTTRAGCAPKDEPSASFQQALPRVLRLGQRPRAEVHSSA